MTPNCRVALRNDSYTLHKILPNKVDPLVSLMMVEKVPDSTYEMIGGLDKQIKEIKEVIELPVKHPELFEALGIAQPKVRAAEGQLWGFSVTPGGATRSLVRGAEVSPWPLQGVLLYGPPGTGKTLLARAVAHHTDCTFIRVSGSELVQKFIGEGKRAPRRGGGCWCCSPSEGSGAAGWPQAWLLPAAGPGGSTEARRSRAGRQGSAVCGCQVPAWCGSCS